MGTGENGRYIGSLLASLQQADNVSLSNARKLPVPSLETTVNTNQAMATSNMRDMAANDKRHWIEKNEYKSQTTQNVRAGEILTRSPCTRVPHSAHLSQEPRSHLTLRSSIPTHDQVTSHYLSNRLPPNSNPTTPPTTVYYVSTTAWITTKNIYGTEMKYELAHCHCSIAA